MNFSEECICIRITRASSDIEFILKNCSLGTDVKYNAFFYTEQELFVPRNLYLDRNSFRINLIGLQVTTSIKIFC